MDGLWYSLRLAFCRLLLVGSLVIVVVVLNSSIRVLQMLSVVEMWLEGAGPLARKELVKKAGWTAITRRSTLFKLVHGVLCATSYLGIDLLRKVLSLLLEPHHIVRLNLRSVYICGEASLLLIIVFTATTTIDSLVTVGLMPLFAHHRDVVGEVRDAHLSLLDRLQDRLGQKLVLSLLELVSLHRLAILWLSR